MIEIQLYHYHLMRSPIKFIANDNVAIVWAYADMPPHSPGELTLYNFYLDPSLEARKTSQDDEDDNFGWQTYFNRRSFRQGVARASQSLGVKIRG